MHNFIALRECTLLYGDYNPILPAEGLHMQFMPSIVEVDIEQSGPCKARMDLHAGTGRSFVRFTLL
jgi:hypothetical protein